MHMKWGNCEHFSQFPHFRLTGDRSDLSPGQNPPCTPCSPCRSLFLSFTDLGGPPKRNLLATCVHNLCRGANERIE
jgi:hypothetical protein